MASEHVIGIKRVKARHISELREKMHPCVITRTLALTLESEALKRKLLGKKANFQDVLDEYIRKGLKADGITVIGDNGK